jgi:carbon-monoxide dehydrogenase large subunit
VIVKPLEREEATVANQAYRAVFLRVHPTGKMVLSLTTEADGNEGQYAAIVADELGVPALDVKVVPADENRFGTGHGFNTSPSDGTPGAIVSASGKIRAKAQLLAGVAMDTPPESLRWDNGAFVSDGNGGGAQSQTIADLALYAHGSGALPPGVEGGLDAQTVYAN